MDSSGKSGLLRALPSIEQLLQEPSLKDRLERYPRPRAVAALRAAVERARSRILSGNGRPFDLADVDEALSRASTARLRRVINATGVVLHTNLGRAPLAEAALERMAEVARGYSNLELDLQDGERGSRYAPVVELLRELTGAPDAMVVNNGAAAILLALAALAVGKAAVVSRGELVEIGGGFRIPEVMEASGARLVEVGTTNRTRLEDYERALTDETGVLLKVHRSNFALVGFTEEASVRELAQLASLRRIPLIVDMGSGQLEELVGPGLTSEPTMRSVVSEGADLVTFSGDKLLGGPQAGVAVGTAELVGKLKRHPLNRALRVDKLVIAALEATLQLYSDAQAAQVPVRALLSQPPEVLEQRARRLQELLQSQGVNGEVVPTEGQVGGGTMPLANPPSCAVALDADAPLLLAALRQGSPPVIGRIGQEQLLLDVRCILDDELEELALAVGIAHRKTSC